MIVRPAEPADIPGIARVHFETWRTTYAGLISAAYLAGLTLEGRESLWTSNFKAPLGPMRVAVDGDEIVGFAYAGPPRGENAGFAGELYALYVLDRCQGLGLGGRLFRSCMEALRALGVPSMVTWVLQGNPASGFYAAMGGRPAGSKKFMMGGEFLTELGYGWRDLSSTRAGGGGGAAPATTTST
jgi:L-amino acid N-acyltransferase YncA